MVNRQGQKSLIAEVWICFRQSTHHFIARLRQDSYWNNQKRANNFTRQTLWSNFWTTSDKIANLNSQQIRSSVDLRCGKDFKIRHVSFLIRKHLNDRIHKFSNLLLVGHDKQSTSYSFNLSLRNKAASKHSRSKQIDFKISKFRSFLDRVATLKSI